MNPFIYLLLQLIIGPKHGLVHISSGITLDFSYFGIKRPLSNFSCRKQTGILTCLTIGVNILASTTEIQLVLSSQYNVGATVWRDKDYMYLRINFVFFTDLYMNIISSSVKSDDISGLICNL